MIAPPKARRCNFMLQIKFVQGKDLLTLESSVNAFLASLSSEEVREIKREESLVTILYERKDAWVGMMCCDCQHWDDGGETTTSGICHECGKRRRFNCKACEFFKDVRR